MGSPVETTFRYQGDAIVAEYRDGTLYREYLTDEQGTIVKMVVPVGQTGAGTYLPTWNGHGDAMALWKVESNGTLTLANSFTYGTWGQPTTATHNSIADLGFRFLYVGAADVQWDGTYGLPLIYMHARHYSPLIGRFLQPDPSRLDARLFVYVENGPISKIDPSGTIFGWALNDLEAAYCRRLENSSACAVNVAIAWKASEIGIAEYGRYSSFHEGRGDALRHFMWQSALVVGLGWMRAQAFGNLHEGYAPAKWIYWKTGRNWGERMDLFNNEQGRIAGEYARANGLGWNWLLRKGKTMIGARELIFR